MRSGSLGWQAKPITPAGAPRTAVRRGLESPGDHGQTPPGGPRAGARGQRALLHRLRQRRLVDLLRARPRGQLRAGPDARRLHHHGLLLLLHRRVLRRGDGDVPRGGRLLQLRPPRVQRVLVVRRRLGGDAHLHGHDRHLGVLRAALHRRALLGPAAPLAGRHRRRGAGGRRAGGDQRLRRQGVDGHQRHPGGGRLPHPAPAGADRPGDRARPGPAGRAGRPGHGAGVERLHPRHPDRHARLHGHRDDLEHGRGGQGRGHHDPRGHQPRPHRGVRHLLHAPGRRAVGPARGERRDEARASPRRTAASPATRSSAWSRPWTSARSSSPRRSTSACSPPRSCSSPPTRASSASRGSCTPWASTARCPTACAACTRATAPRGSASWCSRARPSC